MSRKKTSNCIFSFHNPIFTDFYPRLKIHRFIHYVSENLSVDFIFSSTFPASVITAADFVRNQERYVLLFRFYMELWRDKNINILNGFKKVLNLYSVLHELLSTI